MRGVAFGVNDAVLAVFTALAPAAALAYLVLLGLAVFGRFETEEARARLERWLALPLLVAMAGLVVAASHLGNAANALFVFTHAGSAGLSTEVLCTAVFLALGGFYWLAGFYLHLPRAVRVAWYIACLLATGAFLWATTVVYREPTVLTWSSPVFWAVLPFEGLAASGPLGCLVLVLAGQAGRKPLWKASLAGSVAGLAVALVLLVAQLKALPGIRGSYGTAQALLPSFPVYIVGYGIGMSMAIAGGWFAMRRVCSRLEADKAGALQASAHDRSACRVRAAILPLLCCLLAFAATFAARFSFYCFHMTAGLS